MRQRSEIWAKLAVRGRFGMDVAAEIGGVMYTAISAPVIDHALLSNGLSVGNCSSASMKVSVLTDDVIPAAASVGIKARLFDDNSASEWLTFGTYYIDKREENNGLVTLQCFDSMLKANQNYVDPSNPQDRIGWPKSMERVVEEIAERIGVEIDPRTVIKTTAPYQVPYPTNYTMQQVLGFIGACHGGNWIITPENKLRLVPIVAPPPETFDIIDYEYNKIYTGDGYKLVYQNYETSEPVIHPAGGDLLNVPIVTGKITTAKRMKISRVTLARDNTLGYTLGDDTGIEIRIESNPYACQAICDDLYASLKDVEYAPFTITKSCYDPCAELGDWIIVGDKVRSTLYSQKITLGTDFRADAAAPGKDETGTEYPYLTEIQKLHREDERLKAYMEDAKDEISSRIEQTYEEIILEVSGTYATKDEVSSAITLTAESIDIEVKRATAAEETLSGRIGVTESSITAEVIRATGAETELSSRLTLTEEGITAEVTRAISSEESLNTIIEVTASSIRSEVSTTAANLETGITEEYTSAIEQLANSITLTVTAEVERATGVETELSSRLTLTEDGLSAEVIRATSSEESLNTKIEVTASSIRSEISASVANLEAGITEEYTSAIEQLANSITLTVTNSTDSSTIKLTGEGITAQSKTIKFTGDIVFASNLTDGETIISGDNITTGHIKAGLITSGKIQSKNGKVYFDLDNNEIHCDTMVSTNASSSWLQTVIAKIGTLQLSTGAGYYQTHGFTVYQPDNTPAFIALSPGGGDSFSYQGYTWGSCPQIRAGGNGLSINTHNAYNGYGSTQSGITFTPGGYVAIGAGVGLAELMPDCVESKFDTSTVSNLDAGMIIIKPSTVQTGNGWATSGEMLFRTTKASFSRSINARELYVDAIYGKDGSGGNGVFIVASDIVTDNLTVSGTKSRVADTASYDRRLLYCYEMPSPMFGDVGEGTTDSTGICIILFDDIFAETIATEVEYQVFLQTEGRGELWVAHKDVNTFTVTGTPNLKFAWEVKIRQRGFEGLRLEGYDRRRDNTDEIDYAQDGASIVCNYIREMEEQYEETDQLYKIDNG